mmetsp:Transcript_73370/g.194971  ORF Transcript_73370/g.194971 Transcript_73370/m.194971 type:complete len:229 (+) Transcript_73370:328-1014(+)
MPTSITIAPGLIQSPRTRPALPTATTTMSAFLACAALSRVSMWQMVAVQPALSSIRSIGIPTMLEAPMTTASLPRSGTPSECSMCMQPSGVHGANRGSWPASASAPIFSAPKPSTSFWGWTAASTARSSMCGGSGSCTMIPCTSRSAFSLRTSSSTSSCVALLARRDTRARMPHLAAACSFFAMYDILALLSPTRTTTRHGVTSVGSAWTRLPTDVSTPADSSFPSMS